MSELTSNVNLAQVGIFGNTGNIPQNIEPGIPKAIVLVPKGTAIPATAMVSQAALLTYVTAAAQGFLADTRKNRWFILQNLDDFKDATKQMASVDTGLNQFDITKFNTKYTFRILCNKANHKELMSFDNVSGYDAYIWDSFTNAWGQLDSTGAGALVAYTVQQLRIMDWSPSEVKDFNQYRCSIQFKNRLEFNENFHIYTTGIDCDNITTLMNAVMSDVSATLGTPLGITTTTTIVAIMKAGGGSIDLASPAYYQNSLTAGCFTAKNLTAGTTLTISTLTTGTIIVANQVYNYLKFVLSAAPTATHIVQIALAAPSVVNPIIGNFNAVTEIVQPGVDAANAAVHTF